MFRKSAALHETRQKIKYTRSTSNASCALQRPTSASTTTKSDKHKHVEALFDNLSLPPNNSRCSKLVIPGIWWCFFFPPGVFSQLPIGKIWNPPSCAAASADSPPFLLGWSTESAPHFGRAGRATWDPAEAKSLTEAGRCGNMAETWLNIPSGKQT